MKKGKTLDKGMKEEKKNKVQTKNHI